jgi:hypothetical protein
MRPAVAGHAFAWISDVIAHAKDAKGAKSGKGGIEEGLNV